MNSYPPLGAIRNPSSQRLKTASGGARVHRGRRGRNPFVDHVHVEIGRHRAPHGAVDRDDGVVGAAAQLDRNSPRHAECRLHRAALHGSHVHDQLNAQPSLGGHHAGSKGRDARFNDSFEPTKRSARPNGGERGRQ